VSGAKKAGKAEKSENWESVPKSGPSIGIPEMIQLKKTKKNSYILFRTKDLIIYFASTKNKNKNNCLINIYYGIYNT